MRCSTKRPRSPALLLCLATLAGCVGGVGERPGDEPAEPTGGSPGGPQPGAPPGGQPGAPPPSGGAQPAFAPGQASLRLLTVDQYRNAVRDLLGDMVAIPPIAGWHTALQGAQGGVSPQLAEQYEVASLQVARAVFGAADVRARVVGCDPTGTGAGRGDECVGSFMNRFMRRAWRRTPSAVEAARYLGIARTAGTSLADGWRGLEFGVAGVLQSPHFLYRAELGEPVPGRPDLRRFTSLELASRLAFFLWNSIPDDALLEAGERGALNAPAGITEQVRRLIASPRSRLGLRQVFEDMLDLHSLPTLQKDAMQFPTFGTTLADAMQEEVMRTIEDHLFVRAADYRDLFVRRETFVNNALARHYGLPVRTMDGFRPATWLETTPRAGLLGFAGLLALQANQLTASPTLRGKHVREVFLCLATPPPPPDVDTTLPPVNGTQRRTTRQRLSEHQNNPTCAGCHALMDPLGFALESFDAVGAFRTQENGLPIDTSGRLEGVPFTDAQGLGQVLRDHPQAGPCLARQLYRYAVGRLETDGEEIVVKQLTDALAAGKYRIAPLAEALATSEWFRLTAATE